MIHHRHFLQSLDAADERRRLEAYGLDAKSRRCGYAMVAGMAVWLGFLAWVVVGILV